MKRLLSALLVLLASVAGAQVVPPGGGVTLVADGTSIPGCTAYSLVYIDANGNLRCAQAPQNGSTSTAGTAITKINATITGASATSNWYNLTGTFPNSASAAAYGLNVSLTSPSSAGAFAVNAARLALVGSGSTFASTQSFGLAVTNSYALTGKDFNLSVATEPTMAAIYGGFVTSGSGVGVYGQVSNASTGNNGAGVVGKFVGNANTANGFGGVFTAQGSTDAGENIGLAAVLAGATDDTNILSTMPSTDVAGLFDNGTTTGNIIVARDNGTAKLTVQDGGSQWVSMGSKNLTLGGGAVNFVQVAVSSNSYQGGMIDYCADASDGTEYQTRCGSVPIALINKGGVETCTVGTPGASSEVVAVSAGTFTVAFTTDTSPTNACNFAANGTSSLTETVMRINFTVRLFGNAATAVTAQ